jgi:hypothetical protein
MIPDRIDSPGGSAKPRSLTNETLASRSARRRDVTTVEVLPDAIVGGPTSDWTAHRSPPARGGFVH